jgi:hypothetical protein
MLTTIIDQKHLFKEAKYLIKSCMKYMPDEKFVLNLINVAKNVDKEVESWHNNIIIRHLSLKIQKERYEGYMYCAMSFPLYDLLTEFNEPLIYLDADIVLRGRLDEIVNDLNKYDLMIRYLPFQNRRGPTTLKDGAKVNNGVTAIAPSTGGKLFAKNFREKILNYLDMDKNSIFWHEDIKITTCIDQEFIYVTMKELEKENRIKIFPLDNKFNDSYFLDSSLVWHAKGSARIHSKYLKEKAKYDESKIDEVYFNQYIIIAKNKIKKIMKQIINHFHRKQLKKIFKELMKKIHVKDTLAINCDLEELNLDKSDKVKIKAIFFDPVLYYKYKDTVGTNVYIEYIDPNGFSEVKISNEISCSIVIFGKNSVNNTQLDIDNIINQCKVIFVHNEVSFDRNLINDYEFYKRIANYEIFKRRSSK